MFIVKGIILAGGMGTRLSPITDVVSKQLLPIYNSPMIFHPISTLMKMGIKEILVISTPRDLPHYSQLLGDGERFGVNFSYIVQNTPGGLPQAFLLGEEFIGDSSVALILGDNIFHSDSLSKILNEAKSNHSGATIFGIEVSNPGDFGIAIMNEKREIIKIVEKPNEWVGNTAVTGLYIYDADVIEKAKNLTPSDRGELEISELNQIYLEEKRVSLIELGDDIAWMDTGTFEGLYKASEYVRNEQLKNGSIIGDISALANDLGFINSGK